MIVMKFGGSSLANAERIRHVAGIVKAHLDRQPILVLSAMGDTTDHLLGAGETALKEGRLSFQGIIDLHRRAAEDLQLGEGSMQEITSLLDELRDLLMGISLLRELTGRTRDYLVSFGERLSVRIVASYLTKEGLRAHPLDAWDAGFLSDSNFTSAELLEESWSLIPARLLDPALEGSLPVVTGFIAKDEGGNITTLGRGGSDLSATMIGASCGAEEVQVWKDVDGILTADPNLVKKARVVDTISYEAASELAYFGAQVLHPRAMQPCIKTGTMVRVKNSYNPSVEGTRIMPAQGGKIPPIQAITSRKNVTLIDIVSSRMLGQHGFLGEVFTIFARGGISVDMVATSEVSVSLTVDSHYDLAQVRRELLGIASVEIKTGKAIVSIIGDVRRSSEILSRTFRICELLGIQVQMVSQGASKVNNSFIVDQGEAAEVVRGLHEEFFEEDPDSPKGVK
ncbi:MAG: aspartate kinase [Treponema sp.]|nr:aspartate kinase [Treponema sp.]